MMPGEAVVLAGGFGTRLRAVVSDVPKPLAPVAGRPFLHWLLDTLAQAADALASDPVPGNFAACATGFAALDAAVRSHFRYEEDQIGPAIGFYEVPV